MVKIGKCTSCGHYINQIWRDSETCPECGDPISVIDVDMGSMGLIHRIINYGGIFLMLIALGFFIFNYFGDETKTSGILAVVIFIISVIFFAISLVIQYYLSINAIEIEKGRSQNRSTRKVREPRRGERRGDRRDHGNGSDKSRPEGRKIPVKKGTKVPVGRRWGRN